MYPCMYGCMHACMHVDIHVYMYMYICICICVYVYMYICICIHVCKCICIVMYALLYIHISDFQHMKIEWVSFNHFIWSFSRFFYNFYVPRVLLSKHPFFQARRHLASSLWSSCIDRVQWHQRRHRWGPDGSVPVKPCPKAFKAIWRYLEYPQDS